MKTSDLVALMLPKELKEFEKNVIKNHKRNSLKKLLNYIKKHKEVEKKAIFEQVFGTKYTVEKDALLRNELRLLNKEIETFLLKLERQKKFGLNSNESQLLLLKIYLERGEHNLFEQNWRKLYKKSIQERLYLLKINLIELFFEHRYIKAELHFDIYEDLEDYLEESAAAIGALAMELSKKVELHQQFTQRTMAALKSSYQQKKITSKFVLTTETENSDLIQYLDYIIESYTLRGKEKIELLRKALEQSAVLFQYPKYQSYAQDSHIVRASIALEYFLCNEFESADQVYQEVIRNLHDIPERKRGPLVFNYVSNLICLGDYQRVIDRYESKLDYWKNSPKVYFRMSYQLCWAYIKQKEYKKPFDLMLQQEHQKRPDIDFVYSRVLLGILYYLNDNLEFAEREIYNLKQTQSLKNPMEDYISKYAKTLLYFFQTVGMAKSTPRQERLKEILIETEEALTEQSRVDTSILLQHWLQDACKSLLQ